MTGVEPAYNEFAIRSLAFRVTPTLFGTSEENRTLISRLSGATGYKSAVLPLNYRGIGGESGSRTL